MNTPRPSFPIRPGLTLALGATLSMWVLYQVHGLLEYGGSQAWFLLRMLPAQYMLCVCIHDAVHGVLSPNRRVNQWGGALFAMGVGLPFPLLRRTHLRHHDHLHDHDDPERVVYALRPHKLLLRLPLIPWSYLQNWRLLDAEERHSTLLLVAMMGVALGGLSARYGASATLQAWVLPSVLTIAWFGFTTVYVPHSKHSEALMRFFTEHSGWHHDHHRAPQYPFHQYLELRAFHLRHGVFEPRGPEAHIVQWLAKPLRPKRRR